MQRAQAFTIIELLIVMMIIITLMSIGVGAWLGAADKNESLVTQELVYSLVQQARNRSVSSGEPVVLHIFKDANTILGLHKNYLWHKKKNWIAGTPSALPPAQPGTYYPLFIEDTGGFTMRCQVNAPPAATAGAAIIPLILITAEGNPDTNLVDSAIAGLELWKVPQFINHDNVVVKVADTWSVVGWVGSRPSYPSGDTSKIATWNSFMKAETYVREWSFDDDDEDSSTSLSTLDAKRYSMKPYTGDQWHEVEVIFDNNNLYLYRNGQRVDFLEDLASTSLGFTPTVDEAIDIYIASHSRGSGPTEHLSIADINDAAVLQIGTGDEEYLPGSITSKEDYKIVCADGVIKCYDINGAPISTLTFVDDDGIEADNFEITINPDGSFLSSKVFTQAEISAEP